MKRRAEMRERYESNLTRENYLLKSIIILSVTYYLALSSDTPFARNRHGDKEAQRAR